MNVSSVLYYLAKAARANPAFSIAITQSSLRGHQHVLRQSEANDYTIIDTKVGDDHRSYAEKPFAHALEGRWPLSLVEARPQEELVEASYVT